MNRRNPQCCCDVAGCCEIIEVKPLPTRTVVGGVASYSDTAWNGSYVTGISGTDNTVPANTTVTINVPIGCTDYVVDVEVLDDNGTSVTNSDPGLVVKVGESLQAANVLRAVNHDEIFGSGDTSFVYEDPTIFSQHDVLSVNRSASKIRPFYGDNYIVYRFYEIFHSASMNSGISTYKHPPFRTDTSTSFINQVNSLKPPTDAGGLTVQITIETGNQPVEIGLIQVHSGHISCSSINALDTSIPIAEATGCYPPLYTIKDPSSYIYNNATSTMTSTMTGNVRTIGGCASTGCTYDYEVNLSYSQWTGNHNWSMKWNEIAGYFNFNASTHSYHATGTAASAGDVTALVAYLSKCDQHNWTHSDRLIDWRAYEWVEPELSSSSYSVTHTLGITGTCNIVAETQANITADLDLVRDARVYPSGGPLLTEQRYTDSVPCPEPAWCSGDPQLVYENIVYNTSPTTIRKWCKPIMEEDTSTTGAQDVKTFWNLPVSFTYPNAKASTAASDDYNFTRSAIPSLAAINCGFTYSRNLVDVDLTESATITKIPFYSETDLNYSLIGGAWFYVLPTRNSHLVNLSLYISSESATFTSTNGIVMQYSAVNGSTNRPDYATCGCPCTADELYQDDLYSVPCTSGVGAYYHRWMEFTDGTDTWYAKWSTVFPHNTSSWTFLFRRASDCKEIQFTGVSNTLPSIAGTVSKTATNGSGDTLAITVQA